MKWYDVRNQEVEHTLFVLGWIFLLGLILFFILKWFFPVQLGFIFGPCPFRALTGIYCLGCGGTRSLQYLIRAQIVKSVIYHPFVIYGASIYTVFMISHLLSCITRNKIKGLKYRNIYIHIGIAILIINFIIKNYLLFVEGIPII